MALPYCSLPVLRSLSCQPFQGIGQPELPDVQKCWLMAHSCVLDLLFTETGVASGQAMSWSSEYSG